MVQNKTLAFLIVLAVVISVGGQYYAINKINTSMTSPRSDALTGYAASATGLVNLTILSQTDITLSGLIDFGTGVVNTSGGCNNATLHSNGTGQNLDNCWVNQSITPNSAISATGSKFVINNSGNVNISIVMDSVANNATNFIGNSTSAYGSWYQYTVNNNGTLAPPSCQTTLVTAWTNFSSATSLGVCGRMFWEDGKDQINVAIRVVIPDDTTRGYKNDNLTFTSAEA